jgi:hypothetical protein
VQRPDECSRKATWHDQESISEYGIEEATIANAKKFVACDYFGSGRSNLRLTIDTTKSFAPANQTAWTQEDGELSVCKSSDVSKCEFN